MCRGRIGEFKRGDEVKEVIGSGDVGFVVGCDIFESNVSKLQTKGWDAKSVVGKSVFDNGGKSGGIEGREDFRSMVFTEVVDTKLELELCGTNGQ